MIHSRRTLLRAAAALPLVTLANACEPVEAQQPRPPRQAPWGGLRVVQRGPENAPLTFVLLHGFGARGDDLVSLADELLTRTPCRFVVPEAPLPMVPEGRAWYAIRAADEAAQIARARAAITGVINTVVGAGVARSRIVVGGFSQGGIMSIEAALVTPGLAGIAVLSGRSLPHAAADYHELSRLRVFASHGRQDSRIAIAQGEAFMEQASAAGAAVDRVIFDGDHAIPPVVVGSLATWLQAL